MEQSGFPLLSLIIFIPLAGAIVIALLPRESRDLIRYLALFVAAADFILSGALFFEFQPQAGLQFIEHAAWIPQLGINYFLAVDGISVLLIPLSTLLTLVSVLFSWNVTDRQKEFMAFMLVMETGMLGVFAALDLFLFYVFWEAALIPMYFLIGVWGHENRIYATVKFILYTMAGSVLMLVAIVVLSFLNHRVTGVFTFDWRELQQMGLAPATQTWLFLAFALAFAIKVPLFPFHTWLPDAHVEAPTAGSVLLAGILLKMGTYGFLRFCLPFFPEATLRFLPLVVVLAIIGIIYAAMVAFAQDNVKSLVAYSSVSHLGFVMLGIFALNTQGLAGGVLQMVNHGLSTGALFLIVGMIYERRHTLMMRDFGGLWRVMPIYAALSLIVVFASAGLPGLNGFIGEFLILVGAFRFSKVYAFFATIGVILAAVYLLWMFQQTFFGPLKNRENEKLVDLSAREVLTLLPLVILIIVIGVYPDPFLRVIQPSVQALLSSMGPQIASLP
ncbi:MAG: NADH-quinone oxidoreductase subunit M [Chloroflexi bacterium]|nr:MAG: NADH-quinone oxidoreductase subunit M [Chloroflexota bacterium]